MKIVYNYFVISLIFILTVSCNGNNNTNVKDFIKSKYLIPDSLVYATINYFVGNKEANPDLTFPILLDRWDGPFLFHFKHDSIALTKLDSLFSKEDVAFIFSQRKQFEKFTIDPKLISGKEVVPLDSLLSDNSKYKTVSSISFPLFNLKKDIVIIGTYYYCGAFCYHSGIYIYQRKNSKWVLLKIINETIS